MAEIAPQPASPSGVTKHAASWPLAFFVGKVILWAAVFFTAWYVAVRPVSLASGWIAARLVEAAAPIDRARIEYHDRALLVSIDPDYETMRRNSLRLGTSFETTVNARQYSYGLPFFLALMLASRPRRLIWKIVVGAMVVIALSGAGIGSDALIQFLGLRAPRGDYIFLVSNLKREFLALSYQIGSLIFPPLAPLLLWITLDWRTVESLARRR